MHIAFQELQWQVCEISALAEVLTHLNSMSAMICIFKDWIHFSFKYEN
jgi:hypothetical protein